MYYIAVVKGDLAPRYAEHYETEEGFLKRRPGLELQSMVEGEGWRLYTGEEPYECAYVRMTTPSKEGEDEEEYEGRIKIALKRALDSTTSVLTPTMLDDRPEWYKLGYDSQVGMEVDIETQKSIAIERLEASKLTPESAGSRLRA